MSSPYPPASAERPDPRSGAWVLWRQDDNGNRVGIETFATREAALARQAEFESRHHKQIYWVEAG